MDLYHLLGRENVTLSVFGPPMPWNIAKNELLKSAHTGNPIWPPEYDLPGNFIFSLHYGGIVVTPHHSEFYGWWMATAQKLLIFHWKIGFPHFAPEANFSRDRGVTVGTPEEVGANLIQHLWNLLRPGYVTKACFDWSFLSMVTGAVSDPYPKGRQQWFWLQTPENQKGGPWPLWYMESSNHMAHGPCIHEYFW